MDILSQHITRLPLLWIPAFSCARRLITPHILFSYSICEPFSGKVAEATIIKTLGNPSNRTEIRPNCYLHTQNKICFTDRASLVVSVPLSETWETSWIKCCANLLLDLQKEHRLLMVSFWLIKSAVQIFRKSCDDMICHLTVGRKLGRGPYLVPLQNCCCKAYKVLTLIVKCRFKIHLRHHFQNNSLLEMLNTFRYFKFKVLTGINK